MLNKSNNMTDSLMSRFTHALNSPISTRCAELTVLIDRGSSKDLQHIFPTLIESIFGASGGLCWGLRNITQTSNSQDFITLHHFLGPLGPVFRLIYKLLTDTQVKYEYSVSHLPMKLRQTLENGKIPPFYSDLLNIETQTRKIHSLSLNPFDFYMFHFAFHLTNPWQQRNSNSWSYWYTVYYVLSSDYIFHFLPTDPNAVILPRLVHFTGKNPTIIPPQSVTNRPQCTSKLFRSHVLQQNPSDISSLHQPMQQHPRGEIWRSETIVQVFIDIWLNNDQLSVVDRSFNLQSKVNELPTGEYVRLIRVFVKQLHAFSASGRNDTTTLGELKKIAQSMLQGPMYAFLRYLVYRWPLDASFRLVLELWLSYIQPWRYLGESAVKNIDNDNEDPNAPNLKFVDQQYIGFIADNLLVYTVIFQQLLPRFSRIDLNSPKNACMLFRVLKVFGQPNLVTMIREIEGCVETLNHSPTHSYNNTPWVTTLPPLSPTACWSTNTNYHVTNLNLTNTDYHSPQLSQATPVKTAPTNNETLAYQTPRINMRTSKWAAIVRHRIFELEGPEFCYKPMFTQGPAPEVIQLCQQIHHAESVALEILNQRLEESKDESENMFSSFFKSLFASDENVSDEFSVDDRKRVPMYLKHAKQYLVEIFRLDVSQLEQLQHTIDSYSLGTFDYSSTINNTNVSKFDLSPAGARLRAKSLKYEGDPDLHPIRSNENAFLVRVLYHLAEKFNQTYANQIRATYYRNDFLGKLSRQVLNPPTKMYTFDKSHPGYSPRVQKTLPPRISLRSFASHSFLACFLFFYLFAKYSGYSFFTFVFIIFLCYCVFIIMKALFNYNSARNLSREFFEVDDSFDTTE